MYNDVIKYKSIRKKNTKNNYDYLKEYKKLRDSHKKLDKNFVPAKERA
jgi:hypothetical protein